MDAGQAGPQRPDQMSDYRYPGGYPSSRNQNEGNWDAFGEIDPRERPPRGFWRDIDEGSGYTYRDPYYDSQQDGGQARYSRGPRFSGQEERNPRYSDRWSPDPRYMERGHAGRGDRYPDPRARYPQRASERDYDPYSYRNAPPSYRTRERDAYADERARYDDYRRGRDRSMADRDEWQYDRGRAVGPRGWRGDIATQSGRQSNMYRDRGAVGPQGWQPDMAEGWQPGQ